MKTSTNQTSSTDTDKLWNKIVDALRQQIGVGDFGLEQFITKLQLREDTGTKLIVEHPVDFMIDWVEINYEDQMKLAAAQVLNASRDFEFIERGADRRAPQQGKESPLPPASPACSSCGTKKVSTKARESRRKPIISGLNEDYRFDNFIVGDNNRFAYTAALSISKEDPRRVQHLNPFFIHGASGMGKTHLLQAIGNAIRDNNSDAQVLYVTSESFTNAYIEAICKKGDALNSFRRKFRKADVLLIDDVQFLAKRGKTQEEFFHTFNALFESGKQIILCADCPAGDIVDLDERLTSRFQQGLTVCLEAPCFETRLAILRHKMSHWKSNLLGGDILEFLAKHITSSVRTLEGALTRVATIASFSQHSPTVAEARAQLRDMLTRKTNAKITIPDIQRMVAEAFDVRIADLNGRRRTAQVAQPRQIAMFLARKHTQCSLQDIGAAFGGRDHGTVIHATKTVEQKIKKDATLRQKVEMLAQECA